MLLGTLQRLGTAILPCVHIQQSLLTVHPVCMEACWSISFDRSGEVPDACIPRESFSAPVMLWHACPCAGHGWLCGRGRHELPWYPILH